jgi:hypothetical protein
MVQLGPANRMLLQLLLQRRLELFLLIRLIALETTGLEESMPVALPNALSLLSATLVVPQLRPKEVQELVR